MEINHQAIVTELWDKIRNAIDGKIASASGHLAEVIQVADQKIAEAAGHAAAALEAKEGAVQAGGDKAPLEHEHPSSDITDAVSAAGSASSADKVLKADPSGRLYYTRDASTDNELVNLKYLQDQDYLSAESLASTPEAGKAPAYTSDNHIYVATLPTDLGHAASKFYVDNRTPEHEFVFELPSNPDPQVLYLIYEWE